MRRRTIAAAALSLALGALMAPAASADGFFYGAVKAGTTGIDTNVKASLDQLLDSNDASFALGLGARFGDHWVIEAAYHDFGTVEGTASSCPPGAQCLVPDVLIEGNTTAVSVSFLPHLSITERFFAYGKIGVISWDTSLSEVESRLGQAIDDYSDEDLVYGVGARFLLPGPIDLFAEYEQFGDAFETVSVGATVGF